MPWGSHPGGPLSPAHAPARQTRPQSDRSLLPGGGWTNHFHAGRAGRGVRGPRRCEFQAPHFLTPGVLTWRVRVNTAVKVTHTGTGPWHGVLSTPSGPAAPSSPLSHGRGRKQGQRASGCRRLASAAGPRAQGRSQDSLTEPCCGAHHWGEGTLGDRVGLSHPLLFNVSTHPQLPQTETDKTPDSAHKTPEEPETDAAVMTGWPPHRRRAFPGLWVLSARPGQTH